MLGLRLDQGCIIQRPFDGFGVVGAALPGTNVLPVHTHDRAHLFMVYSGRVVDDTHGQQQYVPAGELLFHPAGIVHENHVVTSCAELIVVELTPALAATFAPLYGERWQTARLTFESVRDLPEQIREELAAHDSASGRILPALVEQLLALGSRVASGLGPRPEWLRRTLAYLAVGYAGSVSMRELARHAGVSVSRLSHGFAELMGRPVGAYTRELRVHAAARALREGEDSIAEIALTTGFADQSHLSRVFRASKGVTPVEYRRRDRAERRMQNAERRT
ncbi:MAG TPA: AraC family transcriptional regulator [Thermoanaerobaculia bacterium]